MNYIKLMQPIVQKAGDLVMSHFRKAITISYKNDKSMVTDVDLLVQSFLIDHLTKLIPGSGCIAEEAKISNIANFTWVIDPIDGTKNFVRAMPYFCINVALMHEGNLIAAMTYQPVLQEWFWAEAGSGTFLNGKSVKFEQKYEQMGALVVVSNAMLCNDHFLNQIKETFKSHKIDVRFRLNGAVALDLAYTSAGMFDLVIFQNLAWWDVAAGALLIKEAGGWVSQHNGLDIDQQGKSLIAGEPSLCKMIINLINLQK